MFPSSSGTPTPAHLSPYPPSHQPGGALSSSGQSLQKGSKTHQAIPPMWDTCPASRSTRGGFRLGVLGKGLPRGGSPVASAPSSSAGKLSPPQDQVLSLTRASVHPNRTWTTSTTARTAGSSTCWTSATWRAGESPLAVPTCGAPPPLVPHPPHPRQGWPDTLPHSC